MTEREGEGEREREREGGETGQKSLVDGNLRLWPIKEQRDRQQKLFSRQLWAATTSTATTTTTAATTVETTTTTRVENEFKRWFL